MGWTFYNKPDHRSRRDECDNIINTGDADGSWKVLKSAMVGATYYAAVQRTPKDGAAPYVFAAVFLTKGSHPRDGMNFGYKDMDESVGPCESQCPVGILDMLTPLAADDKSYAADWRKRCRDYHAKQKDKPKVGDMIVLKTPVKFTDGNMLDSFIVCERTAYRGGKPCKKRYLRSTENGGHYRLTGLAQLEFTVGKAV